MSPTAMQDDDHPQLVLPGDRILYDPSSQKIKIGPGLQQEDTLLIGTKLGVLHKAAGNRWWIDSNQRRYIPATNENILGIVTHRISEGYRVDIGAAQPATLDQFAFEGATKRNKPNLEVGTLVYAKVTVANKDMEPEIECLNQSTKKADGYGEIKGGHLFRVSLAMARSLLDPSSPLLKLLSQSFPFEIAVGMNGRIWINAAQTIQVITAANILQKADGKPVDKVEKLIRAELKQMKERMDVT
ncbi:exosome non-catalytic core subunit rrp40 [Rhizophlyctis rosea]|uniref:Ribosomal RNA-processing protein 40 n=1 Tax=Rhizophlyctis rosea TaxID=64517 RepID=A0AAD5X006_9FUNG|nr:exosome non-catalytic core subunit rrp40 [Rhizophlyctis rosea]